MRYKLYTFTESFKTIRSADGNNIMGYYGVVPDNYPIEQLLVNYPNEPLGNTGSFVIYIKQINHPLILAPETSYLFNYDFIQHISIIRKLLRFITGNNNYYILRLLKTIDKNVTGLAKYTESILSKKINKNK